MVHYIEVMNTTPTEQPKFNLPPVKKSSHITSYNSSRSSRFSGLSKKPTESHPQSVFYEKKHDIIGKSEPSGIDSAEKYFTENFSFSEKIQRIPKNIKSYLISSIQSRIFTPIPKFRLIHMGNPKFGTVRYFKQIS